MQTRRFFDDAAGGLLCSLLSLAFAFSYGALIFSGPLQPWLAQGIAASLVTAVVSAAMVALTPRMKGVIAGPESSTVAVTAAMMMGLAPALATAGDAAFEVAIVALSGSALVSGVLLLAMGRLRLGRYVRFVPYPVLAGFMASVGCQSPSAPCSLGPTRSLTCSYCSRAAGTNSSSWRLPLRPAPSSFSLACT